MPISVEDYLEAERNSPIKHEYHDGEVYAMAGASDHHNLITGNLYTLIRPHLRGSPCQTFFADTNVRIETQNRFYYPDLLVTCDPRDRETRYYKKYPKLIIEILSDTTEAFDRGEKFHHDRQLESLEEYVLVNQNQPAIDILRRSGDRTWELTPYTAGETLHLHSLNFDCAIASLYEDIDFP